MNVLVTGGAGYIGSHACKAILSRGHRVTIIDNLFRGHGEAVDALRGWSGAGEDRLTFISGDIGDRALVERALKERAVDTVMHFAAMAYVGESMHMPLEYYRNNTASALSLIEAADEAGVSRFIFSSTCATYGEPPASEIPIRETCPQIPINPYGRSKLMVEHMLRDYAMLRREQKKPFAFAALRYFNVAGCDPEGAVGEHHEPETHIIPVILQAILGKRDAVTIFGTDYPTPDGTCIRDYIHVSDLVDAHVLVMESLKPGTADKGEMFFNLGIGRGYSVREIVDAVRRVTKRDFKVKEGPRRAGDPPTLFADASKIKRELGWSAKFTSIDEIIATAWRWFERHPEGYLSR